MYETCFQRKLIFTAPLVKCSKSTPGKSSGGVKNSNCLLTSASSPDKDDRTTAALVCVWEMIRVQLDDLRQLFAYLGKIKQNLGEFGNWNILEKMEKFAEIGKTAKSSTFLPYSPINHRSRYALKRMLAILRTKCPYKVHIKHDFHLGYTSIINE